MKPGLQKQPHRPDQEHHRQAVRDDVRDRRTRLVGESQPGQRRERGRHAADGQTRHDRPVNMTLEAVGGGGNGLGQRGENQIGADSHDRSLPEHEDQQRRHQRTAADAGKTDDQADQRACGDIGEVEHPASVAVARCESTSSTPRMRSVGYGIRRNG